jgi:hypothetical protein
MKSFLINRAAYFLAKKLDGHKTRISGVGTIIAGVAMTATGVLQLLGALYPEMGFEGSTPADAVETIIFGIGIITGGGGIIGVGHKLEKEAELLESKNIQINLGEGHPYDGA